MDNVPIIVIMVDEKEEIGGDTVLEYELPANFHFEEKLSENFSALQIMQGQFLGFYFKKAADRQEFDEEMEVLAGKLKVDKQ